MDDSKFPDDSAVLIQRSGGCLITRLPRNPSGEITTALCQRVLATVREERPNGVIFDCSDVILMDSEIAETLDKSACAIHLLGAAAILAGLSPALTAALVRLDIELPHLAKAIDLDQAFSWVTRLREKRK